MVFLVKSAVKDLVFRAVNLEKCAFHLQGVRMTFGSL